MRILLLLICLSAPLSVQSAFAAPAWIDRLSKEVSRLDAQTPGSLGVYVKSLKDGSELRYQSDRSWYLASMVKVPVAIAFFQDVESGKLSLKDEVTLQESDYVDGSGATLWKPPGSKLSLRYLLEKMLTESDSTAADLLIRRIGVDELNARLRRMVPGEAGRFFGPITTLLQVRRDAFGEIHPKARELSNMDYVRLKANKDPEKRMQSLLAQLGLGQSDLQAESLEEAFERYYLKSYNSAPLRSYGILLERLVQGRLLNREHTQWILQRMEEMVTGEKRVKAGLPRTIRFAQKTGTQFRRFCNAGVLMRSRRAVEASIVVACVEKTGDQPKAEETLRRLGAALADSGLLPE